MMNDMEYVALIVGVLVGLIYLPIAQAIDWILVVFRYMSLRSEDAFYGLYDITDDETTYEYLKFTDLADIKTYADYLRIHRAARPSAYKRFRKYYGTLVGFLLTRVAPITLLPTIIFWSNWYYYLLGLLFALLLLVAYALILKPRGAGARKRLMVFAVIRDYLKDSKKTN